MGRMICYDAQDCEPVRKLSSTIVKLNAQLTTANEKLDKEKEEHRGYREMWQNAREAKDAAESENAKLKELLGRVEWSGPQVQVIDPIYETMASCPSCGRIRRDGHSPDCELFLALEGEGEK